MPGEPLRRTITVTNPQGLHLRPLQAFGDAVQRFQAEIWLQKVGKTERVNGRSSFDLLGLGVQQGDQLVVEAKGPDAEHALVALCDILLTIPPEDA